MEDRTHHPVRRLGIIALAGIVAFFALDGPARSRKGLRLLGLWTFLAVVNRGRSETAIALDAQSISPDIDTVLPYWGARPWPAKERADEQVVGTTAQPA